MRRAGTYLVGTALVASVQYLAALLAYSLYGLGGVPTLLWVPAATGLAILLLFGMRWGPGIMLGSLAMISMRYGASGAAVLVSAFDAFEAVAGCVLLRRFLRFRIELDRVRDVVSFVGVCAATTMFSVTGIIVVLVSAGVLPVERMMTMWSTWWWSHFAADLIVAPALLTLARRPPAPRLARSARVAEGVMLAVLALVLVVLVLSWWLPTWVPSRGAVYCLLPVLLWAGLRFGPRGAALASLGACVAGIVAQSLGVGPFGRLLGLQTFVAIASVSTLMLSALLVEHLNALERQGSIKLSALDGIITIDHAGRIVEMNPAAERLFEVGAHDAIGRDFGEVAIPPRLREDYQRELRRFVRRPIGWSSPGFRYRTTAWREADQQEFPVEIAVTRVTNAGEVFLTGFIRDVSAERRAEAAQREAQEQLERKVEERTRELVRANAELARRDILMRQAEELAHLGSFEYDIGRDTLKWSDELFRIYGRDEAMFTPTYEAFLQAIHPDDRVVVRAGLERAIEAAEPFGFEERVIRPDGSTRLLQTRARVVTNGGGKAVRIVGCCQDITERRAAEEQRLRLVQLVESSEDAIIGLSPEGIIETWNAGASGLFGYEASEIIGKPCTVLASDYQQERMSEVLGAVRAGKHLTHYELRHRRKDGTTFDASVSMSPVTDRNGGITAISKVIRDVTEQKRFEQQLRASLGEKEVLLREIHHRVKNNLQVIASLLNIQVYSQETESARKGLVESQTRIHSMALVHQLLYQSRDLAQLDFAEYLAKLIERLIDTYRDAPERVKVNVTASSLRLDIDRAIPCGLIVNELVTNALTHAFPDGRVGTIQVTLSHGEGQAILTVSDNGVGLSRPLDIERSGSFGLKIAQTLAHQLDGELVITSENGTRARVVFPIATPVSRDLGVEAVSPASTAA